MTMNGQDLTLSVEVLMPQDQATLLPFFGLGFFSITSVSKIVVCAVEWKNA